MSGARVFFPHTGGQPGVALSSIVLELLAWVGLFALVAHGLLWVWRMATQREEFVFVPFKEAQMTSGEVLVVDCTAPKGVPTLTHHKGHHNPSNLPTLASDTSTDIVLNALKRGSYWAGRDTYRYLQCPYVTTNHFDVDSFLSVWCYCNRALALQHEPVLRHMSRIGDFREAFLSPELIASFGAEDFLTNIRQAFTALKLVCWLNTLEKRLFSAPYESKDCEAKFNYFLPKFASVLADPEPAWVDWQDEYTQVVGGFDTLLHAAGDSTVDISKKVGLAVVRCHEPLHYYSIFSHTHGADVVLTLYDGNRYELECKYTQFVEVWSRGVWPRLDMGPLAHVLNLLEAPGALPPGVHWVANRHTDTGPLLRLEDTQAPLSKAQRYGHPCERPFVSSSLPPQAMQAVVQSFLEFGLQGLRSVRGGWSWEQLRTINEGIPWSTWTDTVVAQHRSGELAGLVSAAHSNGALTPQQTLHLSHHHQAQLQPGGSGGGDGGAADGPLEGAGGPLGPGGASGFTPRVVAEDEGVLMRAPSGPLQAHMPLMSDNGSSLMSKEDVVALVTGGALPARYRACRWDLAYCTHRDGISLHTLYRKAAHKAPTVLVVKDSMGHVFGAFAAEAWHIAPRFYGTGETAVFTVYPTRRLYHWHKVAAGRSHTHNDFFQFSAHEGLGVGGVGHFAIWLDNDLFEGSSSYCDTFGSPCLASAAEFHVHAVELWHLH